jgi:diguanylate cyclase (GGDEF)-like protein
MEEALSREIAIASRYKRDLSLILFDIDHFKLYNDLHGHTFGDLLLKTIGEYLQMNLRSMDIACRYGGEEFLIILPDTSLPSGLLVARKIKTGLGQLRFDDAQTEVQPLQVSMGVTAYQGEDESASGLIQRADQALYQAKETGRNRIVTS